MLSKLNILLLVALFAAGHSLPAPVGDVAQQANDALKPLLSFLESIVGAGNLPVSIPPINGIGGITGVPEIPKLPVTIPPVDGLPGITGMPELPVTLPAVEV